MASRVVAGLVFFSSLLQASLAAPFQPSGWGPPTSNSTAPNSTTSSSSLPVVDLGYERQRATLYNSTGGYYNFSNIRYAAPPTGNLRFRAPQKPTKNRKTIQTGTTGVICPQATPAWELIAAQFIPEYLNGQTVFNSSSFNTTSSGGGGGLPPIDPRTSEDCLFLDVMVPKTIFDSAGKNSTGGAPVLVWIYGGGYTMGDKSGSGDPAGLLLRSMSNNSPGVIYVAMNYRLGAFGWLSGPTFQADGTANAGLYDQRFALQWVQQHIASFGGDPKRVTVFGESAGGGSLMHQITAYGGLKPVPFQQALLQSPGWQPLVSNEQQEGIFDEFLGLLKVSTVEQARALPFEDLLVANIEQVGAANYGSYVYGPAVDGDFVPAMPGELLLHGQFAKNLNVMTGHNADEGLLFTSPFNQNNSAVEASLLTDLPTLAGLPNVTDYIFNTLYPPIFDGSQAMGYTNQIARAAAITSELIFTCNTFYLDKAYNNQTHSYYFTIPPALHGEDVPYTYYNGPNYPTVLNPQIAEALQSYITRFAETGNPNEPGVPYFPKYGSNATVLELGLTGISTVRDPTANYRCDFWQKVLYE